MSGLNNIPWWPTCMTTDRKSMLSLVDEQLEDRNNSLNPRTREVFEKIKKELENDELRD